MIKDLPNTEKTKQSPHVRLLVLVPVLLMLAAWAWRGSGDNFSSYSWQLDSSYPIEGPRDVMVDDLVKHHLKPGMTIREVVALLGADYDEYQGAWFYPVHRNRRHGEISQRDLMLTFDVDDKLAEAKIISVKRTGHGEGGGEGGGGEMLRFLSDR